MGVLGSRRVLELGRGEFCQECWAVAPNWPTQSMSAGQSARQRISSLLHMSVLAQQCSHVDDRLEDLASENWNNCATTSTAGSLPCAHQAEQDICWGDGLLIVEKVSNSTPWLLVSLLLLYNRCRLSSKRLT